MNMMYSAGASKADFSELKALSSKLFFLYSALGCWAGTLQTTFLPCPQAPPALRNNGESLEDRRRERNLLLPVLLMSHLHCPCKGTSVWLATFGSSFQLLQHSQNQLHYDPLVVSGLVPALAGWSPFLDNWDPTPQDSFSDLLGLQTRAFSARPHCLRCDSSCLKC